ncbi:MAG: phosphate acetyltransferase [Francisellaceae bacterium]
MTLPIVLLPTGAGVGNYSLKQGLQYALQQQGYNVELFHPLQDIKLTPEQIEYYFLSNNIKDLFEIILAQFDALGQKADFVLVEGFYIKNDNDTFAWLNKYTETFNSTLIRALNARVILVARQGSKGLHELQNQLEFALNKVDKAAVIGAIITKLNAPVNEQGDIRFSLLDEMPLASRNKLTTADIVSLDLFRHQNLKLLGTTEWNANLTELRMRDIRRILNLKSLNDGDEHTRRVKMITMCARGINHCLDEMNPGTLIITSADRTDIIIAATLAAKKGVQMAGLILTASYHLNSLAFQFCLQTIQESGLPIYTTENKSISTILKLSQLDYTGIPDDDEERLHLLKESISRSIDIQAIEIFLDRGITKKMSPPAFRYYLIKMAQKQLKRIVLPEGNEPRTIEAAIACHRRQIAKCVLLGKPDEIKNIAKLHGLSLPEELSILDPQSIKDDYVSPLLQLRKAKGLTEQMAKESLEDPITLGTMMLKMGDVDGLVSGAIHTTANTIRPALKIIKTKPECALVSSVFFMCMEEQVLVFGDCAVNPDPSAENLADIAIESAASAMAFGIEPKIAMLSYSTGSSGSGVDVEKVKKATELVKNKRPDLIIDGPLQYDAATIESVAKNKAPMSPVAGKATVLIFPDLNTGNTTYKAVQRSANVLSIGPVLQGLNKPVNDLSRGATVDDIIYTIAITAIQSQQKEL